MKSLVSKRSGPTGTRNVEEVIFRIMPSHISKRKSRRTPKTDIVEYKGHVETHG